MGCLSLHEMDELVDEKDWGPALDEREGLPMLGQHGVDIKMGIHPRKPKVLELLDKRI